MNLTWDHVDSHRAQYDSQSGWVIERPCTITGVTETGAGFLTRTINDAIDAGLLPQLGTVHPDIANAYCFGYAPEPLSQVAIRVRVMYRQVSVSDIGGGDLDTPIFRVGASLSSVDANKDKNGDQIRITWTDSATGTSYDQGKIVSLLVPQLVVEVQRTEFGSPMTRVRPFMRSVNQAGWLVAPDDPEGTWKYMGCQSESRDFGVTYSVRHEFHYRESGWDPEIIVMDKNEGSPVPGATLANGGAKKIAMYTPMDYNWFGFA